MAEIATHHGLLHHTKLHVEDTGGSGRPVVLIHGWPLSGASWSAQVPALEAAGYRVVTYDRRGFGQSEKPHGGYDYDTFAGDLASVIDALGLEDVTLVGFSMGGGEVARYMAKQDRSKIHSVVFASSVTPYLAKNADNPDGPLTADQAKEMEDGLKNDENSFYAGFVEQFYTAGDELKATPEQVQEAIALTKQADHRAALESMAAFGTTDFRNDLAFDTVPTLVIHGKLDGVVPYEGSGKITYESIPNAHLSVIADGPHGINVTHADRFNEVLIDFLAR